MLVGDENVISDVAVKNEIDLSKVEIVHAASVIDMEDKPMCVVREKKDSSMSVGLKMLANGEGDAFVSAGNTGALVTGATLIVRRIIGINRAAIASQTLSDNFSALSPHTFATPLLINIARALPFFKCFRETETGAPTNELLEKTQAVAYNPSAAINAKSSLVLSSKKSFMPAASHTPQRMPFALNPAGAHTPPLIGVNTKAATSHLTCKTYFRLHDYLFTFVDALYQKHVAV